MRIAYHNPWINSAENQAYMSMAVAAQRIGHELFACSDEVEIEACQPDFVVSVSSTMAKIVDVPSYTTVHEPVAYLMDQPSRLRNLFTFDGYLTISDSLARFIADLTAGVGRPQEPGFFYNTPQVSRLAHDWSRPPDGEARKVVYFGTNWAARKPDLFRALDPMGIMRLHGPQEAWEAANHASYRGPVPFDGEGPQRIYAECGMGLVVMDDRWEREDVISNRIFEISSVGAVAICPDLPWIRKWFGSSVLYFAPNQPAQDTAEQIAAHHAFCIANPAEAGAMAARARGIFERHFAAERMLENLVEFHARKLASRQATRAALPAPERISVIMRCGGRPLEVVRRAVDSIRRQTYGRFTVIFAKYRDIDLSALTAQDGGAIDEFIEFLIPGGNRGVMLFEGVRRVKTPYFAILDDDDFWFSEHFEDLFRVGRQTRADFDMAFSGSIGFDFPVILNDHLPPFKRTLFKFGYETPVASPMDILNAVGTNCFVARRDLLSDAMLQTPAMNTAEDSLLIALLSWRSKPIFSYRATAFYRRDAADGSNWESDPRRAEDELSLGFRMGLAWAPVWLGGARLEMSDLLWARARDRLVSRCLLGDLLDRLRVGPAGTRLAQGGVTTVAGMAGLVVAGASPALPPTRYALMMRLSAGPDAAAARGAIGRIEILAAGYRIAEKDIWASDSEVVVSFTVAAGGGAAEAEIRVLTTGSTVFVVSSMFLERHGIVVAMQEGPASPGVPVVPEVSAAAMDPALPVQCASSLLDAPPPENPGNPEVEALRLELAALYSSTSWRITAPLRRLMTALRRR